VGVLNIGSIDEVRVSNSDKYSYSASKAAMNMLSHKAAAIFAAENITLNAIALGPSPTKLVARVLNESAARKRAMSRTPLGRAGACEALRAPPASSRRMRVYA
jgi:NAD(P)-dependent dehydrogenase (short-subunit alcohol dehydrogenase family)